MINQAAGGESSAEPKAGSSPRLYQRVYRIVADQIERGVPSGELPLTETALAARFGISRAPARRALAELEQAGLIERTKPHGFVVKSGGRRKAAANADGILDADTGHKLVSLPSWERIYGEVESEIIARISFATWRVNEAELARYYQVSRTVARDVIGRLQQRGVVRKDDRSRWFAPALTPRHVGELYELRWLLEPVALAKAVPNIPQEVLTQVLHNLDEAISMPEPPGATLDSLERDLHVTLLGYCDHSTLMQAITQAQSLLIAHRFLYRWTSRLFATEPFLPEHLEVVERLLARQPEAAARALETHLRDSQERAIARIDVISRGTQPDPLSYLERIAPSS